ncbi:hypothetical protein IHQ68_16540 [Chelatococcus sambhunathii]|uniref:Histidine kinase n=1 Tax=Chelatococcus sambhunathii TaxID=363953 RepID=A0ABU1DJD1_9HYPH|nr:hypothetical protein [Chelatococcus sambhunathii]MDR4308228.1 hypothetical protein [Chelatococcus sambhunathii]
METAAGFLALAAALLAAAVAILRANARDRAVRRAILADCSDVLEAAETSVARSGYGVLRGVHRGRRAALTPIADALAFRKLPQLWLAATLLEQNDGRPSIEIIRRPGDADAFTGGAGLPLSVRPPAEWPQDTSVRVSPGALALLGSLGPVLAEALADDRLKAITVSPRGVRIVRQAAQGLRGSYVLFRETRFDEARVDPSTARAALDLAAAIADHVQAHDQADLHEAA